MEDDLSSDPPLSAFDVANPNTSNTSLVSADDSTGSLDPGLANSSASSIRSERAKRIGVEHEYAYPNNEGEQNRLDLQHSIFMLALNASLFLAPMHKDQLRTVLDIGCGTGLWAIDFANKFPNARVEGFDISPLQPGRSVPPNCQFYIDDFNSSWEEKGKYSFIHSRALTLAVKSWPRFFSQAYDALVPGGYIECHEYLVPFHCKRKSPASPFVLRWIDYLMEGVTKLGCNLGAASNFKPLLQDAGFQDVTLKFQDWPVGTWAKGTENKRLGKLTAENFKDGIRNSMKLFTGLLGWSEQDFEEFAAKCVTEIDTSEYHLWTRVAFVYARKPG